MKQSVPHPRIVLMCHEEDQLDCEGLASWLASTMNLIGVVIIREGRSRLWRVARRQIRRHGWLSFVDVVASRLYAALALSRRDGEWKHQTLTRLRSRFPADLKDIRRLVVSDPNSQEVCEFISALQPDLLLARCKFILKRDVF